MWRAMRSGWSAAAVVAVSASALGAGVALDRKPLNPESRLWVEGTATTKSYKCEAGVLDSEVATTAPEPAVLPLDQLVASAIVVIPVDGLDCGNGTMNGHMRKALKMAEHPTIEFHLDSYTVDGADAVLTGSLLIAGTENPVEIPATIGEEAEGIVRVKATKQIRMTEWGVKPPSLLLGTMKVRDPVDIHFDVTLKR